MTPSRSLWIVFSLVFAFATVVRAGDTACPPPVSTAQCAQAVPGAAQYQGDIAKYRINGITIHTYTSKEAYNEWSILFETDKNLVLLEPQPMPASSIDFRKYIESLGKPLAAVVVSYHGVGPESFPGVPIYASPAAIGFIRSGQMARGLVQFSRIFPAVDVKIIVPNYRLDNESMAIGGINFLLSFENSAWPMPGVDVGLPDHKMVYIHALGGDTHSVMNSREEIDKFVEYLGKLKDAGYEIFLTSHHAPETVADVDAKIAYLQKMKKAAEAKTEAEFLAEMRKAAPGLKGEAYLGITAANLYKAKAEPKDANQDAGAEKK